jgi:tRNA-Thr(GGU) m(6)t(6)A37 methyltransferase TsaA
MRSWKGTAVEIVLRPIGFVRNDFPPGQKPPTWQGISSRIELDPRWTQALSGLAGFSHIIVLCYLHLSQDQESPALIRPQRHPEMPLVGFFGTRTPVRPNPVSVTTVPLIKREGNVLHVCNLDMYDSTPVLDIKPYLLRGDCHPQATEPEWIHQLRALQDAQARDRENA